MPGVPSNRACERCKQRHLKCDETRPGCQRCATAGIECPGYPQTRKFIDEGATVRRRYGPYQRSAPRSQPSSLPENQGVLDRVSSPKPDSKPDTGLNPLVTGSPTPSAGHDLQVSLKNNLLENQSREISSNETGSNHAAFQPVSYPTGLELPPPNISPNRSQQAQEGGLLTNSISNDVQNAADFNGPASTLYDSTFNVPLDFSLASILDQGPYSTPLASSGVLDQRNGQKEAADYFSELMMNSEREIAFLIRHFSEFIAPWLDLFDSGRFFAVYAPMKASKTPFIRYAAAAVASKHLARLKGVKPLINSMFTSPATTEVYPNMARVDWFFKASNYYHQALSLLRQAVARNLDGSHNMDAVGSPIQIMCQDLGLDTGSLEDMRSPEVAPTASVSGNTDDILTASVILTIYDLLDTPGPEWESRLLGIKPLLESLTPMPHLQGASLFSHATRAAIWNFAWLDYLSSYANRRRTRLDPDHYDLWRAAGIPIDDHGKLRLENAASMTYSAGEPLLTRDDVISHGLTWLMLKLMNFIAEFKEMHQGTHSPTPPGVNLPQAAAAAAVPQSSGLSAKWQRLSYEFQSWYDSLPETFQPYLRIEHPQDLSRPDAAPLPFPEILYSSPARAATMLHYNFARIILLLNRPTDAQSTPRDRLLGYRETTKEVDHCCREISGVALGRPQGQGAVQIHMVQPLFVVGQCFDSIEGRPVVVDLLRGIEADFGWVTEYRVRQLQALWDRA
ncbi:hypothetical protein VTN77DRAFT_4766 [Rasamsonia byssochlamydoides]|uniref:uncharacterized protein n=1 Tax=Rasamsonia byssochlamydoides TaxID=89139 RepID=UPI00374456C7